MSKLNNNTTQLEALLEKVNALPEAGDGGSVETCTVTINSADYIIYACATTMIDGEMNPYYCNDFTSNDAPTSITIENVVCGSTIALYSQVTMASVSFTNGGELINQGNAFFTIKAPLEAGANTTVNIIMND